MSHHCDCCDVSDEEIATLRAEVDRLTREREDYREKRANENADIRTDLATAGKRICELIGERDEARTYHLQAREAWHKAKIERDAALSRVGVLEGLVREADEALLWAKSRSPEAAMTMVKEATAWQVRARAALAPRSERREGEP